MEKEIYISESMGESRIAIIEDGTLVEVYVEKQDQQRMVGNIYKGKVENVEGSGINAKLTILFFNNTRKKLIYKYANLEVIK